MKICKMKLHTYEDKLKTCPHCRKVSLAAYSRYYREIKKDHLREYQASWYQANKGQHDVVNQNWRKQNSEKVKEIYKAWYESNKVVLNLKGAAYAKANPSKKNANSAKRRAVKLQATPKWLTPAQLKSIELFYRGAKWVESILEIPIEVDHIIPLQGEEVSGLHVPWNLQLLTKSENRSKGNK